MIIVQPNYCCATYRLLRDFSATKYPHAYTMQITVLVYYCTLLKNTITIRLLSTLFITVRRCISILYINKITRYYICSICMKIIPHIFFYPSIKINITLILKYSIINILEIFMYFTFLKMSTDVALSEKLLYARVCHIFDDPGLPWPRIKQKLFSKIGCHSFMLYWIFLTFEHELW